MSRGSDWDIRVGARVSYKQRSADSGFCNIGTTTDGSRGMGICL